MTTHQKGAVTLLERLYPSSNGTTPRPARVPKKSCLTPKLVTVGTTLRPIRLRPPPRRFRRTELPHRALRVKAAVIDYYSQLSAGLPLHAELRSWQIAAALETEGAEAEGLHGLLTKTRSRLPTPARGFWRAPSALISTGSTRRSGFSTAPRRSSGSSSAFSERSRYRSGKDGRERLESIVASRMFRSAHARKD